MTDIFAALVGPLLMAIVTWQLVLHTVPPALTRMAQEAMMAETGDKGATGLTGDKGATGQTGDRGEREPRSRTITVVLIASFVIIVIGVQALLDQRQSNARDARDARHDAAQTKCIQEWADDNRTALTLGRNYTKDLEVAERRRDDAVDEVLRDFVQGQNIPEEEDPPQALIDDFYADLAEFSEAKDNLVKVQKEVDQDRIENIFPVLDLNCAAGRKVAAGME